MTAANWTPPPIPAGEFRGAELSREVLSYCERYYALRWGAGRWTEADRLDLDYRDRFDAWEKARPIEEKATKLLSDLKARVRTALEFSREHDPATGWQYAQIVALAPAFERILDEDLDIDPEPQNLSKPVLRFWLEEQKIRERFGQGTRDLSVLSLLAGFWPQRVRSSTVSGVLTEQDKDMRAAQQHRPIPKSLLPLAQALERREFRDQARAWFSKSSM